MDIRNTTPVAPPAPPVVPPVAPAAEPVLTTTVPAAAPAIAPDQPGAAFDPYADGVDDEGYVAFAAEGAPTAAPSSLPPFLYAPVTLPEPFAAQYWTPDKPTLSGSKANEQINQAYNGLSVSFDGYLNPPPLDQPPLPSWAAFGQHASRQAGAQIHALETVARSYNTFLEKFDKIVNDPRGVNLGDLKAAGQALKDIVDQINGEYPGQIGSLILSQLGAPSLGDIATLAGRGLIGGGLSVIAENVVEAVQQNVATATKLHQALVKGNTEIFNNIGPAYDIFMRAEAAGQDGVVALQQAGYNSDPDYGGSFSKDPQGFVIEAFKGYQEARKLGEQAAALPDGDPRKAQLLADRKAVVDRANLYIGLQEQDTILQVPEIFDDPQVAGFINALQPLPGSFVLPPNSPLGDGSSYLNDPNGRKKLVPNWTDFPTRMGLVSAPAGTPGAVVVDGKTYVPKRPMAEGTIIHYFSDYGVDPSGKENPPGNGKARRVIHTAPPPLPAPAKT